MNRVERTALVSIAINIGLVLLKVFLAFLSGSIALVADAWHSGSDVASSGLVWAGARISRRANRARFATAENVVGICIAALILWAAVGIFRKVSALSGTTITYLPVAIGGSLLAALVSYYAAQYKLHVGREEHSLSLTADGYHSKMDTLTTGAVIVGLMGHAIGIELDHVAAVVVGLFIVESALVIFAAAIKGLREGTAADAAPLAGVATSGARLAAQKALTAAGLVGASRRIARAACNPQVRRRALLGVVLVAALAWLLTGISFVGPGAVGVRMRWGRAGQELLQPGPHLKAPWPIDKVVRVEAAKIRRVEVGFRTRGVTRTLNAVAAEFYASLWESRHAAGTYEKIPEEALRLTGDENIVDMNLVVFYTVSDPQAYLFGVAQTDELVAFSVESVTSLVAGGLALDDILTDRRSSFEQMIRQSTQQLLDEAGAGVELAGVRLQDVHPPLEVVPAFRDVASAREDKVRITNEAMAYTEETVPKARGDAQRLLFEAQGYRTERSERAHGDADRFTQMARRFRDARAVSTTRLYIETMEGILAGREKYIVSSDVELEGYDLRVLDKDVSPEAALQE
jgi:membrane protease subunit HflK